MTCGKCRSDAVLVDDVIDGVPIPRCWICGWRHMQPEAPPILEADRQAQAAPLRRYEQRQRAQGLCGNCEQSALPGLHYCADHLEFHSRRGVKSFDRMREAS